MKTRCRIARTTWTSSASNPGRFIHCVEKAAASKGGNDETGNDGRDDALFGCHSAGYAKSDCQGQGHYAYDDAGHKVLHETFLVVALQ